MSKENLLNGFEASSISWGEQTFEPDASKVFRLGKLQLTISRQRLEWWIDYLYHQDRYVNERRKETSHFRVVGRPGLSTLVIKPMTADRNVVVRPPQALQIPRGEAARLYIGSPLWISGSCEGQKLFDLPSQILSDTWFGPNTREGDICYANESQARLDVEKLSQRPDRLITPVTITNEGEDMLVIERLNLPLPLLYIYDTGSSPWTQSVEIKRSGAQDAGEVDISNAPPQEQPGAVVIAEPRLEEESALVTRALHRLLDSRRSL